MTLLLYGTLADEWASLRCRETLCTDLLRLAIHRISYTPLLFRHLLSHRARRWRRSYPVAMKWCAEFGQWIDHIFTTRIRGVTATCIVSYEGSYHRGKHQHTGYNTQKKAALDHGSCHRECRSCQWRAEHPEVFRDKMHFKPIERPARSDCVDRCGNGSTAARRPGNPTFTATSGNGSFASRGSASLRISSAARH